MLGASDVLPEDGDGEAPDTLEAKRISGLDAREITEWLLKGHAFSLEKFLEKGNVSETHSFSTTATIAATATTATNTEIRVIFFFLLIFVLLRSIHSSTGFSFYQ